MKSFTKTLALFFSVVLFTGLAPVISQSFLDRTKLALKTGNSQKILQMMGDKLQFGFEGEASMMGSKEAGAKLAAFFKVHPPSDLSSIFQGQSKDGRQYFIGTLKSASGDYRVSVYWAEQPREQILSIDFSKE
jgi:hypothetical protein